MLGIARQEGPVMWTAEVEADWRELSEAVIVGMKEWRVQQPRCAIDGQRHRHAAWIDAGLDGCLVDRLRALKDFRMQIREVLA